MMRKSFLLPIPTFLFCLSALPVSAQSTPEASAPRSSTPVSGERHYRDGTELVQVRNLATGA